MTVEKMRYYYQNNLWDINMVDKLLKIDKITEEEYNYIIGNNEVETN